MSKKYKWLKRGLALLVLQLGLSAQTLSADYGCCCDSEWDAELDLSVGYRRDEFSTKIKTLDHCCDTSLFHDKIKVKDLDIYEIGLKGRVGYCDWFVRGFAYWGWIHDGRYKDNAIAFLDGTESCIDADVDGHTEDYSIGLGYLFGFCDNFYVGPVVGWSYNRLKPRIDHADFDHSNVSCSVFDGLEYTAKWHGPWLGIDFIYEYCDFIFDFGYEYHWAHWDGRWSLDGSDITNLAFSDRQKAKHAHGNLLYADFRWGFCEGWVVGLGFMFKDFRNKKGHVHPVCSENFSAFRSDNNKAKVKWHSASVTLDLGYSF